MKSTSPGFSYEGAQTVTSVAVYIFVRVHTVRTNVYIDGFNLYYACLKGSDYNLDGEQIGLFNPVVPIDGKLSPPDAPGWGAEWDRKQFEKRTVEVVEGGANARLNGSLIRLSKLNYPINGA